MKEMSVTSSFVNEAEGISLRSAFSTEDAVSALERSYQFHIDMGEPEDDARDLALDMVECALEAAPRFDFDLRGMVDYIILGKFHRLPGMEGLID